MGSQKEPATVFASDLQFPNAEFPHGEFDRGGYVRGFDFLFRSDSAIGDPAGDAETLWRLKPCGWAFAFAQHTRLSAGSGIFPVQLRPLRLEKLDRAMEQVAATSLQTLFIYLKFCEKNSSPGGSS